jgi:hypothetical protein
LLQKHKLFIERQLTMTLFAHPLKNSDLEFSDWESVGINIGVFAFTTGKFTITDSKGFRQKLDYTALGVGRSSCPVKLPPATGAIGPKSFTSGGYILERSDLPELKIGDVTGFCAIAEISLSAVGGGAATAVFAGLAPSLVESALALAEPILSPNLLNSAKATLLLGSTSVGLQAGFSGTFLIGSIGKGFWERRRPTFKELTAVKIDNTRTQRPRLLLRK